MSRSSHGQIIIFGIAVIALAVSGVVSLNRGQGKDPLAATSQGGMGASLEELESEVNTNPASSDAWRALGEAYFATGRFDDAVRAYGRAAERMPDTALVWSSLGEARVMASRIEPMPAQALADFRKAISIDPKDPRARYFLAVNRDLSGDHEGAITDWLALLADTPPGAPWEQDLRRTIDQVGRINHIVVTERVSNVKQVMGSTGSRGELVGIQGIPGPTVQDLRAAAAIPPSEQREMAQGMVARLEARLRANPRDLEGWAMLMRSRVTLGEREKASAALAIALRANPDQGTRLRQEAAALGVN